jgi:hypothetical protein
MGKAAVPPPAQDLPENAGGAPAPPRLPYAPDPGTYTQLWMAQSATTSAQEMIEDVESYLSLFPVDAPEYKTIQMSVLASSEFMAFLTVMAGDMVVVVQSLGRFSGGLGRQLRLHNRIFDLIGEKVGGQLPPMVMAPTQGIAPWLHILEVVLPTDAQLETLATSNEKTLLLPEYDFKDGNDDPVDAAAVQKLGYIPKEWAAYFLEPMPPFQALQTIQSLIATLPVP